LEDAVTASNDLWVGLEDLREARPAYVRAAAYYDDTVPEVFASARFRRALQRTGMEFGKPFIAMVVDAIVARLKIATVTSPERDQAEALKQVWDANKMRRESLQVHRWVSMYGDAYLIVLPVADDKGTVTGVEMFGNDPLTVRIIYDAENPREPAFAIKRWCEPVGLTQTVHRAELYYPDGRGERWTTKVGAAGTVAADWNPWLPEAIVEDDGTVIEPDDDAWVMQSGHGMPVFHFRNDQPYGVPEHRRGYGAQNSINKLDNTHMGTVDYQGWPQRYALTDTATTDTGDLEPSDFDDDMFPPDPAAGPTDTGDDSSLKGGPGEVMLLRGYKAVGQFDAAQPAVFFDPIEFNVRAMGVLTVTPLHLFDPSGEQPSGQSVRAQDAPFTEKIEERQEEYGDTWKDGYSYALTLLGITEPSVDVRWHAAQTLDDKESWDTAKVKSDLGVPLRQLHLEAGYGEDQVQSWLESQTDDAAELSRYLGDLATLSETLQRIGTAVTLGALDQGQAQALIEPAVQALTAKAPLAIEPPPDAP
jgi:hypothetical protein